MNKKTHIRRGGRKTPPGSRKSTLRATGVGAAVAVVLACFAGSWPGTSQAATKNATGYTVTYAQQPGSAPNYIFPLQGGEWFTFENDQEFGYLMYRPLYWIGKDSKPLFNAKLSLASPPVFTKKDGHTVAKITLKNYEWSDGKPITTRDVKFWMNLLEANKNHWGDYNPGLFPDNVVSIEYTSDKTFVITFNKVYNHTWLTYDELDQIFPIPQHAWDRLSLNGPIGNYDETPAGAKKVFKFLDKQSRQGSTWASSKLWKVVDGPWKVGSYTTSNGRVVLVRNNNYSGSFTGNVTKVIEEPFTTAAAEYNAVRSGKIDFGYVPFPDATKRQIAAIKGQGYNVQAWNIFAWNFWPINFANPQVGTIFKQLYVRQALEHLINQKAWIKNILRGYAVPEYSAIPVRKGNPYLDKFLSTNHYPFSIAKAKELLAAHGWAVDDNGIRTCTRPGTASNQCGPGVKAGAKLQFKLEFGSGIPALRQEVVSFQSAAKRAGIDIALTARPFSQVFADYFSCMGAPKSACHWQLLAPQSMWLYGWYPYYYPVGVSNWGTGAGFNGGQYSNKKMDAILAAATQEQGKKSLFAAEHFVALQLPTLWPPGGPFDIAAIRKNLHIPVMGMMTNLYPEDWSVGKGK